MVFHVLYTGYFTTMVLCPHFKDEDTEAERGDITFH